MKKLLLIALLLSVGSLYAQNVKTNQSTKTFTIELSSLDDVNKIKWNKIKRFCKKFDEDETIYMVLVIGSETKKTSKGKIKVEGVDAKIDGKAGEIKEVIKEAKEFFRELKKLKKDKSLEIDF